MAGYSISESIVQLLQNSPLSARELLMQIRKARPSTTKQAVYLAIRNLKAEEKITTHGKLVSLSRVWLMKQTDFFAVATKQYSAAATTTGSGYLNLEEGDKVSYSFKNPAVADVFWAHAVDILADTSPHSEPIYFWNPHEWFLLAHHNSEKSVFDRIVSTGKQIFMTCAHSDPLDKFVAKEFDGERAQYYLAEKQLFPKPNYYLNIFGDYILEAWLDETSAKKIDGFYKMYSQWNEEAKKTIEAIVNEHGKTKLTIARNARRAKKLKTVLGKPFYKKQTP